MLPGIHASVNGGLVNALSTLHELGLVSGQIFTSNQKQWKGRPVTQEEEKAFGEDGTLVIVSHASYLINLSSTKSRVPWLSAKALEEELTRMHRLGIRWLVMHPGAHLNAGEEQALEKIASGVRKILTDAPEDTAILFENTAGQGTTLGYSFEQLDKLLRFTDMPDRTGICFDTCHAFAAGYDLSSNDAVSRTMQEFDEVVGLEKIKAFHINDSKKELGSRLDRHAKIGEGFIGLEPFRFLASMEIFNNIPGITETPGSDSDRAKDAFAVMKR